MRRVLAAAAIILSAGTAFGESVGTIQMQYSSWYGNGTGTTIHWLDDASHLHSDKTLVGLGRFNKTAGTGVGALFANGQLSVFCKDLYHTLYQPKATYDVVPLSAAPNGKPISPDRIALFQELFGRHYTGLFSGSESDKKNKAESFGLCVWELMNETGGTLDVKTGPGFWTGYGNTTVTSTANGWLASLDGQGPKWNVYALVAPGGHQDFMIARVPEPATLVNLLAGGALGLGWLVYRRRRSREPARSRQ